MGLLLALACALAYGGSDFLGGLAGRRTAALGVVAGAQAAGLGLLLVLQPWFHGAPQPADWGWGALCGAAGAGALVLLFRGLAIGTMGVVSPITAVLSAVIPVTFAMALRGERPGPLALAGIAAALAAVACVSLAPSPAAAGSLRRTRGLPPGLVEAVGAGVLFGLLFVVYAQIRPAAGLSPLLLSRGTTIVVLAAGSAAAGRRSDLRIAPGAAAPVAGCGALDVAANVSYLLALHHGLLSIVSVVSSLYPAVTVGLAGIVLRERLGALQWAGVALALAGVVAIAA